MMGRRCVALIASLSLLNPGWAGTQESSAPNVGAAPAAMPDLPTLIPRTETPAVSSATVTGDDSRAAVTISSASPVDPVASSATVAVPAAPPQKPLSIDSREMDVVDFLKMLARQNGLNMVIGKNVSGRITAFLNNVNFWQALHTILAMRDLAYHQTGDLLEVMTAADYEQAYGSPFGKKTELRTFPLHALKASTAKLAVEPFKSKVGTITVDEPTNALIVEDIPETLDAIAALLIKMDVPQDMRVFHLNYASADDIQPKIASLVSKEYGNLQVDHRSNAIIVQDNPVRVAEIAEAIKALDVRDKAVLIEAKIVQITLNRQFQMGVNWQGVNWSGVLDKLNGYHVAGTLVQNLQLVDPATVTGSQVTAPGITAQIGILEKPNFQAVVNALDTIGTTNLLSAPRVMALNRQEAKIHVGSKVAKITKTLINAGSTTTAPITTENVEFLDVGVKLSVTPSIGDDGMITMKVKPEVSSVESTITTPDGASIPVIRVSEAEASVVVKNGITVVIGGLMEDSKGKTDNDVPLLGRIPLIGLLFRSRYKTESKTELAIFLTPHIIDGDTVSPEAQEKFDLQPNGQPKKKGFFRRLFGK